LYEVSINITKLYKEKDSCKTFLLGILENTIVTSLVFIYANLELFCSKINSILAIEMSLLIVAKLTILLFLILKITTNYLS